MPIRILRPSLAFVHALASGHPAQAAPKAAICPPALTGRIVATTPAGHVTVPASVSITKRSLAKRPAGVTGGWTLVMICAPAASRSANKDPAPYAAAP